MIRYFIIDQYGDIWTEEPINTLTQALALKKYFDKKINNRELKVYIEGEVNIELVIYSEVKDVAITIEDECEF